MSEPFLLAVPRGFMLLPSGLRPHYLPSLCFCPAACGRTTSLLCASAQRPAAALPPFFVLLPSGLRPHCPSAGCPCPAAYGRTALQLDVPAQRPAAALPPFFVLLPSGLRPHCPSAGCPCPAACGRTALQLDVPAQRPAAALPFSIEFSQDLPRDYMYNLFGTNKERVSPDFRNTLPPLLHWGVGSFRAWWQSHHPRTPPYLRLLASKAARSHKYPPVRPQGRHMHKYAGACMNIQVKMAI